MGKVKGQTKHSSMVYREQVRTNYLLLNLGLVLTTQVCRGQFNEHVGLGSYVTASIQFHECARSFHGFDKH